MRWRPSGTRHHRDHGNRRWPDDGQVRGPPGSASRRSTAKSSHRQARTGRTPAGRGQDRGDGGRRHQRRAGTGQGERRPSRWETGTDVAINCPPNVTLVKGDLSAIAPCAARCRWRPCATCGRTWGLPLSTTRWASHWRPGLLYPFTGQILSPMIAALADEPELGFRHLRMPCRLRRTTRGDLCPAGRKPFQPAPHVS